MGCCPLADGDDGATAKAVPKLFTTPCAIHRQESSPPANRDRPLGKASTATSTALFG